MMRFPSIYYTNRPSRQECSPSGPESNLQTWYKQFLMTWQHCFKAHCAAAFTSLRCRSLYLSYRCCRALSGANCALRLAELRDTESYKEKKSLMDWLYSCHIASKHRLVGEVTFFLPCEFLLQCSQVRPCLHTMCCLTPFLSYLTILLRLSISILLKMFKENLYSKLLYK